MTFFLSFTSLLLLACGSSSVEDSPKEPAAPTVQFKILEEPATIGKNGATVRMVVQSEHQPVVSSDAKWFTVETGIRGADAKTEIKFTAPANTDTDDKSAVILVKDGEDTKSTTLLQTAKDGLILAQTSYSVPYQGGNIDVKLQTNVEGTVSSDKEWVSTPSSRASMHSENVKLTVAPNSGEARKAVVTFTYGDLAESVSISQEAYVDGDATITASAADIAKLMYPGWNLGNTMEAGNNNNNFKSAGISTETAWQSTKTTQAVIDAVKAAGFKSVRIPCAWVMGHISGGTQAAPEIDRAWMKRVKEVVDYCINDGLYVVLNDHWDGGWLEELGFSSSTSSFKALTDTQVNGKIETLKYLWTQIANEFRDYDEHLLFAGLNEPFQNYNLFNSRHQTLTPTLIKYNKAFVETVRATGGNNTKRILVVQGPSTNIDSSVKYMDASKLPEQAGKLMVEVHFYDPGQFCGTYDSTVYFWGKGNHSTSSPANNATWAEEDFMKSQFQKLGQTYTSKGYPVVIGEYAAMQRKIPVDQDKHDASVKLFYKLVNEYGINNGIIPFAWDTNYKVSSKEGTSTIIDRSNCTIYGKNALEGITEGVNAGHWPY